MNSANFHKLVINCETICYGKKAIIYSMSRFKSSLLKFINERQKHSSFAYLQRERGFVISFAKVPLLLKSSALRKGNELSIFMQVFLSY